MWNFCYNNIIFILLKRHHVITWKWFPHVFILWTLDFMMLNLPMKRRCLWQSSAAQIQRDSVRSMLCATWLSHKHSFWEHWRLVALWGRLPANLFCAVNNDKRACTLFTSTVQAVIVRSTRSLANVCVCAVREDEAGWLAAGQTSIQNTSVETEWGRMRESGEELGWAFIHRAIIQSLVNIEEKLSTNTRTVLHGHNQSWKKGSCSSHQGQLVQLCFTAGTAIEFLLSWRCCTTGPRCCDNTKSINSRTTAVGHDL